VSSSAVFLISPLPNPVIHLLLDIHIPLPLCGRVESSESVSLQ
jgi:hypothetical protein